MTPAGFPHSEIHGSKRVCRSPWLIAACRVLHRRSAPRHSPFTLSSLAIKYFRRESYKIFAFKKFANHSILLSKTGRPETRRSPRGRPVVVCLPNRPSPIRSPGRGGGPGEPGPGFIPEQIGGAERDRTVDLRLAKPPLSQLSYSPDSRHLEFRALKARERGGPG
jgi:hypothetical protein